jgi:fructose-specific component phosphotransferase system IIB-like protein
MSQQIAAAERSLAEVSADEIVESVLIAVANIPINPALRGDLVYIKDVYAAIRALKGTFSLRASGTPERSKT